MPDENPMTSRPLVLSLFPGIGLLDRAFEECGFTIAQAVRAANGLNPPHDASQNHP
jgi:site-specific DNA-cytosine methylase